MWLPQAAGSMGNLGKNVHADNSCTLNWPSLVLFLPHIASTPVMLTWPRSKLIHTAAVLSELISGCVCCWQLLARVKFSCSQFVMGGHLRVYIRSSVAVMGFSTPRHCPYDHPQVNFHGLIWTAS